MGHLIVQEFVSADGFAADANNEFTFYELLDGGTTEFDHSQQEWLKTVDVMVLGANTYREFAEYWPTPASANEIIAPSLNGSAVLFSPATWRGRHGEIWQRLPSSPATPLRRSDGSRVRPTALSSSGAVLPLQRHSWLRASWTR